MKTDEEIAQEFAYENPFTEKNFVTDKDTRKKKIPMEIYSRVVGYFRPVSQWNPGAKSQFEDRQEYNLNKMTRGCW